jgi:hypothetical protein
MRNVCRLARSRSWKTVLVRRYAERRQLMWSSTARWAREHPRLSRLTRWLLRFLTAVYAIWFVVSLASGRWDAAIYFGMMTLVAAWITLSWMRISGGKARPASWRG